MAGEKLEGDNMSKQIRISDEVYKALLEMQRPQETFSKEVERLVRVYKTLFEASNLLGPSPLALTVLKRGVNPE